MLCMRPARVSEDAMLLRVSFGGSALTYLHLQYGQIIVRREGGRYSRV